MRLHALEHAITIDAGHHDVEEDEIERFRLQPLQRLAAVHGTHARVPEQLELLLEQIEIERLVIDDEDPRLAPTASLPARRVVVRRPPDPALTEPPAQLRK